MNPDSRQGQPLWPLYAAIVLSSMPGTIILPMMPALGEKFGASAMELGVLFGIFPLMSAIAAPLWGRLSDRLGRRPALIGALICGAASYAAFAFATSFSGLVIARALQGLSGSTRGIGFAIVSDISAGPERTTGLGRVSAAMAIGFMLGPLVGAIFMSDVPGELMSSWRTLLDRPPDGFDHTVPSLLGTTVNLLGLALVLAGVAETLQPRSPVTQRATAAGTPTRTRVLDFFVMLLLAQFVLSGFIQGTFQFSFALWADMGWQWNSRQIAFAFAALGLGFVIAAGGLLKPLGRRLSIERMVLVGIGIDIAGILAFVVFRDSPPVAIGGLFLSSLGGAIWATSLLSMLSRDAHAHHAGMLMGFANSAGLVGRVLGPPAAGFFAAASGPVVPFLAILASQAVILLRAWQLVRRA
ncbi:MAG: MFS transporter [Gammaproteobacteria bacterium]|nr:MFS transporter [Gammaproteobacteria bacterium]